jgi:AraC-like DNA-binding protein
MWSHTTFQLIRRARSNMHRHGALQLTLGIEKPLRLGPDEEPGPDDVTSRAILVAANQYHWFESEGWVAALWLEPESRIGRLFAKTFLSTEAIVALPIEPLAEVWPQLEDMTTSSTSATEALEIRRAIESVWFEESTASPPLHPALRRAIRYVRELPVTRVSASELAEVGGVSETYLLHLFSEQLGIPLRRFVLWWRMRRAVAVIVGGGTATKAAHDAGFHDSSHLTRTFKELLAVSPRELAKAAREGHFEFCSDTFELAA